MCIPCYSPGEKYYINGEISYYKTALYYYGIGNDTRKEDESVVSYNNFILNQRVEKSIAPNLFVGVQYALARIGHRDGQ